jgi:dTMP kinase
VAEAFRALAAADPDGIARIDAIGTPKEVHARILTALSDLLGEVTA